MPATGRIADSRKPGQPLDLAAPLGYKCEDSEARGSSASGRICRSWVPSRTAEKSWQKKSLALIKLQCPGGQATPRLPVGPRSGAARGEHRAVRQGVQRRDPRTGRADHPGRDLGLQGPHFSFMELKSPPAAVLLKKAAGLASAAHNPGSEIAGQVTALIRSARSRRSRWPTSTPRASRRRCASSKAPPVRVGSRWSEVDHGVMNTQNSSSMRRLRSNGRQGLRSYSLSREAIGLLKSMPAPKFEETVRSRGAARHRSEEDRPAGARLGEFAQGHRQVGGQDRRVRRGRQGRRRPRKLAPTSSGARTSPRRSRGASPTST